MLLIKETNRHISSADCISRFSSLSNETCLLEPVKSVLLTSEVIGVISCICSAISGYSFLVLSTTAVNISALAESAGGEFAAKVLADAYQCNRGGH